MIERAWALAPGKAWYVFFETDTYIFWDNMLRFLENFDPDTPQYMGSPSPGRVVPETEHRTWFANGGPGFVLSRAAVQKMLVRKTGVDGDYLEPPMSHRWADILSHDCCGDSVLGWVLHHAGVPFKGFWPLFNPHSLHTVPFSTSYWCQPMLTLHKTRPDDMLELWRWEHHRRQLSVSAPLLVMSNMMLTTPETSHLHGPLRRPPPRKTQHSQRLGQQRLCQHTHQEGARNGRLL
jgi:hypothetical protein